MLVVIGINGTPLITPLFQTYVEAPLPESVTGDPAQTVVAVEFAATVGHAFTVMVIGALVAGLFERQTVFDAVTVHVTTSPFNGT